MSTTMIETWVQELSSIGPIYPFVGSEGVMVFLLLVSWLGWHVWQLRHEKKEEEELLKKIAQEKK